MMAIPSMGTPTIPRIIIRSGTEPPGIPAVPMAVMTAITTTTSWAPRDSSTPNTWARKSTVAPSKSAVPFMLRVAPSGRTKPQISGGMRSPSRPTLIVVGSVALLEDVENAVRMTISDCRKNSRGLRRATSASTTG